MGVGVILNLELDRIGFVFTGTGQDIYFLLSSVMGQHRIFFPVGMG